MINKRLWAKWAENKKKENEMQLITEMEGKGIGVADIMQKTKRIHKNAH